MSAGGGGEPSSILLIHPSASGPHRGGGGDDRVEVVVGELAEVAQVGVEIGDGDTLLDVPVEMIGEGAAAPEHWFGASELAEAARRDLSRCVHESPTAPQRYSMAIVMAGRVIVACAQTGSMVSSFFSALGGPVAAAAPGGVRGNERWEQWSLAAKMHNQAKSVDISLGAVKYEVIDEAGRILDMRFELQRRRIVDMMNIQSFPPNIQGWSSTQWIVQKIEFDNDMEKKGLLLIPLQYNQSVGMAYIMQPPILVFLEMKQETDSLQFWLFLKGFCGIQICGNRTDQRRIGSTTRTIGSSIEMNEQKIEFVNDRHKRGFLRDLLKKSVGFVREWKLGSLYQPLIASFQSSARVLLLIIIILSLIPRSTQLSIIDNTTEICPALHMEFKRPDPFSMPRLLMQEDLGYEPVLMLENECLQDSTAQQWVSIFGLIISTLANFAPLKIVNQIRSTEANNILLLPSKRNILLLGISCLLFFEMNLSKIFYERPDKCDVTWVDYFTIFVAIWNVLYSWFFWKHTSLDTKQTLLAVLACVIIGTIGYAFSAVAGVFHVICLLCGHFFRIIFMYNSQKFHWFTCTMSACGLLGSVCSLYGAGGGSWTIPKVSFAISCAVRIVDMALQVFFRCRNEQTEAGINERLLAEGNEHRRELAHNEPDGQNIAQGSELDDELNELDDEHSESSSGPNNGGIPPLISDTSSSSTGQSSGSTADFTEAALVELESSLEQKKKNGSTDVGLNNVGTPPLISDTHSSSGGQSSGSTADSTTEAASQALKSCLEQTKKNGSTDVASIQKIQLSVKHASRVETNFEVSP